MANAEHPSSRKRFHQIYSIFCLLLITATVYAESSSKPVGAPQQALGGTGKTESKSEPPHIVVEKGRLSAHFDQVTLAALADAISHKAPVAVMVMGDCAGHLVSANINGLPLDDALRRILSREDVFFFYGVEADQPATLKAVWVYPKGQGRGIFPIPPQQWGSTKEVASGLNSKDPSVRAGAIETLLERKGNAARDQLINALTDSSSQVRAEALYAAFKTGVDLSPPTLDGLLHDSSPDVRFLALQAVSNGQDARSAAQALLNDPSEAVRSAAQAVLSRLNEQAAPAGSQPDPSSQQEDRAN